MAKIALVDDDRNILTSVSMAFEAEGYDVDAYNEGSIALQAFEKKMPDLAVFDLKMPTVSGMELLRKVRKKSSMPVIFLTACDDELDEVVGLRMGADDYVKKPFSQRLLIERVGALFRRQELLSREADGEAPEDKSITRGDLHMDPLRHLVTWKEREVPLTYTEFLLLQTLAERPGFVKNRNQLMDAAYDEDVYIDDRSVDTHIKRIRMKMRAVDEDFSAIQTLYGIGYRYMAA